MSDFHYAWDQTVDDGRFRCTVEQEGDGYRGTLKVVVVETGDVLLEEKVGVSYAALFGPDVLDVAEWQDKCIKVIDEYIAKAG
jgi:hypothetical protein